jgi:hypothetical protein
MCHKRNPNKQQLQAGGSDNAPEVWKKLTKADDDDSMQREAHVLEQISA